MVGDYLTGFIKGRSILDGIVITHEVVHQVRKDKKSGFLLKLDFEKAYNRVNWDCLLEVLKARKFGPSWRAWMETWLRSAKTCISSNGESRKEIKYR